MSTRVLRLVALLLVLLTGPAAWAAPSAAPRIGLVYTRAQYDALGQGHDPLLAYRQSLEEAGAQVVPLVVPAPDDDPRGLLATLDGLLLPGGIDVDPAFYHERPSRHLESVDVRLDRWEMDLIAFFRSSHRPILGICRGEQVLNVALGGTLYQDLPDERGVRDGVSHRGTSEAPASHRIRIRRDSLLYRLLQTDTVVTNSYHHQAVKKLGKGLDETAVATDGVVEAVEGEGILAVQFHPERMRQADPRFAHLFTWLVQQARAIRSPAP